jgi:type II secretory pathway component GspD/PulD (secretin)
MIRPMYRFAARLALLFALAGAAEGQEREAQDVQVSDSTAAFDFQAADLQIVVSSLAEVAGLNIVYGDLPSRSVTLRTSRPVSLAEVRGLLESVARGNDLELIEEDGLIRIVAIAGPEEEVGPAFEPTPGAGGFAGSDRRLFVHRLRHARAETIVQTLRALFGMGYDFAGPVTPFGETLSQGLEEQSQVAYRDVDALRGGQPAQGRGPVTVGDQGEGLPLGLESPVDLVPDPLRNAILILATPTDYEILQGAIDELDSRPLQVLIEVLIAEVRRNKQTDLGVTIDVPLREGDESGVTFNLDGLSAGNVALQFLGIGDVNASVIIRALAAEGDVTILSRPVILAQNNLEARILVGYQRPFIQVFRALPTDAAVRDQVVQYRNVGTQLLIRPTINADGYVNLAVQQEVSVATAETQFGAPVINTREAQTELLVRDGHTVILGGLIDNQEETSNSGVPLLKDIPFVGALFRSTRSQTITTELFLLLTPHVVYDDEEMDETTRELIGATENLEERLPETIPLLQLRDSVADTIAPVPDSIPIPPERRDSVPDSVPLPERRDSNPAEAAG